MSEQAAAESAACICGADEPCTVGCAKHGRVLHGYPCGDCQREWEKANPSTAAAIGRFAAGRGSAGAVAAARRTDATRVLPPTEPTPPTGPRA